MIKRIAYLLLLVLRWSGPLAAQHQDDARVSQGGGSASPDRPAAPSRAVSAVAVDDAVRIDGRLDEQAWMAAPPASGFAQNRPRAGEPATERTEVRVLYTPSAIVVGARMFDSRPDSIVAQLARRDGSVYSDWFGVVIDGMHDRRSGFGFWVNPRGVKRDMAYFNDNQENLSWDAVWDVATSVDSLGWTAEFRIPFSQLRYTRSSAGAEAVWGINFIRDLARRDESSAWSPVPPTSTAFISRAGELHGLNGLRPVRRLEVQPYSSAVLTREPGAAGDPFHRSNDVRGAVGADLKLGVTSSLTLTATINPDFGQVELDPAVVNLTAFETRLPEQRPFFVEGSDLFNFGQIRAYIRFMQYGAPRVFYSRRIGRAPQRMLSAGPGGFVDVPEQTTILGAAKVTGRVGRGWSVGIMNAVTAEERARVAATGGDPGSAPVEPLSNYFVGRVRRDARGGRTVIGGLVTTTHRDLGGTEFDGLLRSRALVGGVDAEHSWRNREWVLSGYVAGSRVEGTPQVITAAQRSSARYYQRPDAGHLDLRPDRTALDGYTAAVALQNTGDIHGSLTYEEVSPGWEPNDLGFQSRSDSRAVSAVVGRFHNRPGRLFRSHYASGYTTQAWNFGGDPIFRDYGFLAGGTFRNLWWVHVNYNYRPERLDDRLTRGGPIAAAPAQWETQLIAGADPRKAISGSVHAVYQADRSGERNHSMVGSVGLRPTASLQLTFGPELYRNSVTDQWVHSRADRLAQATNQHRYVFAELQQTTLAMSTRVNWTFTPTLSLQLYARPFVAHGEHSGFKEFRAPRTFAFDRYGVDRGTLTRRTGQDACGTSRACYQVDPDGAGPAGAFAFGDPDFTVRSLRGNAVLRWEYRPGSTLFFVWQQQRSGNEPTGDLRFGSAMGELFREPAQNVFLVKATYRLGS